ncbi:hypothetical protein EJ05DRAFT_499650 [Pseudovirgaria hyperparasitica]|uniref:MYND-type zinc finger protein samB n=1 Tax=Pseudovirgaria hyperparasitica TaxID=470096 RepID=A0A6A6WDP3_9PEZI|nr:uncharacterized protein EJ05DRAFT_499650 [Pseudovirgaria hyperparasitica]KAF2759231.1 hypothetical protein EJ05DRAFT_499650 [Pseudovirgaria hyperparasitica]
MSLAGDDRHSSRALKRAAQKIDKANGYLVKAHYVEAEGLYTEEVLTRTSPGHACAFIGRALAHLLLDYPELAAMDAYRAMHAANIGMIDEQENLWRDQIEHFLKYMNIAADVREEPWTLPPTCYIARGELPWLNTKLGSIRIFLSEVDFPDDVDILVQNYSNFCYGLKMKARYLLALSLYQLGGGAAKSALDVMVDAHDEATCSSDEREQLFSLESEIFSSLAKQQKEEASAGLNLQRNTSTPLINELMEMKYTRIPRCLYPWDTYNYIETTGKFNETLKKLNKSALNGNKNVSIRGESLQVLNLHLCAEDNLTEEEEQIFCERSTWMVGSVSTILYGNDPTCEGCFASLTASRELLEKAYRDALCVNDKRDPTSRSPGPSMSPEPTAPPVVVGVTEVSEDDEAYQDDQDDSFTTIAEGSFEAPTQRTVQRLTVEPSEGFSVCDSCMDVPFCCKDCWAATTDLHHADTCGLKLDGWIRDTTSPKEMVGVPTPHEARMSSLLLLRIIAQTSGTRQHPLAHAGVQLLNLNCQEAPSLYRHCNFTPAPLHYTFPDKYNCKNQALRFPESPGSTDHLAPWHFDLNIRKPFEFLMKIGGAKLAFEVKNYDGWMLNTMLLKIWDNMDTTIGARFKKLYNDDGSICSQRPLARYKSVAEYVMGETRQLIPGRIWQDENFREKQLWVGSLYPIASILRVEGQGNHGLKANCVLYERNGRVVCRSIGRNKDDRKDSAMAHPINTGDVLVREFVIRPWIEENDDLDDILDDANTKASTDIDMSESRDFTVRTPATVNERRLQSVETRLRRVISTERYSIDAVMMDALEAEAALAEMSVVAPDEDMPDVAPLPPPSRGSPEHERGNTCHCMSGE